MLNFIDLKTQQEKIKDRINSRISAVLNHGQYILGPEVLECEQDLREFAGTRHCITYSNGTDALLAAMMALGLKTGDEVIIPAFSFYATVGVFPFLGLKPVLVDVDSKTYNINPDLIEQAITPKTKAIAPVSLYGQCADMDRINAVAKKNKLFVIEDGAQSFGALYKGKRSCSLSDIGCTSFFPAKPLGCYGDGGACFTDNEDLAQALKMIRVHGSATRYNHEIVGMNGRFDTIQAAILIEKLKIFAEECAERERLGKRYNMLLQEAGLERLVPPYIVPDSHHVFAQYTLQVEDREALREKLSKEGIPTAVHYPKTMADQDAFKKQWPDSSFDIPVARQLAEKVLSLPMHPYLKPEDQDAVVEALRKHAV